MLVAFPLKLYGRKGFKDAQSLIPAFCVKIKSYIFLIFVFSNYVLLFYSSPPWSIFSSTRGTICIWFCWLELSRHSQRAIFPCQTKSLMETDDVMQNLLANLTIHLRLQCNPLLSVHFAEWSFSRNCRSSVSAPCGLLRRFKWNVLTF